MPEDSQPQKKMKSVNINSASAEEISECLLLDIELVQKIVDLQTDIRCFSKGFVLNMSLFDELMALQTIETNCNFKQSVTLQT